MSPSAQTTITTTYSLSSSIQCNTSTANSSAGSNIQSVPIPTTNGASGFPNKQGIKRKSNKQNSTENMQDIPNSNTAKRPRKSSTSSSKQLVSNISSTIDEVLKKNLIEILEQQKEIQSKLEHQISELRQEINIQQLKPKPSTVLNDSLSSKIDKQIEKGKELEILFEEKKHHLDEIASFKADIDKLNQQLKAGKEHEKLSKDQHHLYQQKLKKQATEIKQLNEKLKDQQETNDFLTNQINNLNKKVFELENEKENETNQTFVNKRLLEASLVEDGLDLNASKYLAPVNQNLQRVLDMSGVKTPIKSTSGNASPSATSSNLDTPSTERKKSAQCAQQ